MLLEERNNGKYILTKQKFKNKDIVIKLGSILSSALVYFEGKYSKSETVIWTLEEHQNKLNVKLKTTLSIIEYNFNEEETKIVIEDLINMVKNNLAIDSSELLLKAINETYNSLFINFYTNKYLLYSNQIVNGIIQVNNQNKILGHGSRFILNRDELTVCEYSGNTIIKDMTLRFNIKVDENITFTYIPSRCVYNENIEVYTKGSSIGYLKYKGTIIKNNIDLDNIDIPVLKLPYSFSTKDKMIEYCNQNNTIDDILKYKKALIGKIELININKYMLDEFLI